jgi:hypothetical protein
MARPKKSAAEKQQPAQVPVPPQQHIQHHQQPLVPTPMMPVPVAAAVVPPPQAVMPQRVVDNDSFLRVRDSVSFSLLFLPSSTLSA